MYNFLTSYCQVITAFYSCDTRVIPAEFVGHITKTIGSKQLKKSKGIKGTAELGQFLDAGHYECHISHSDLVHYPFERVCKDQSAVFSDHHKCIYCGNDTKLEWLLCHVLLYMFCSILSICGIFSCSSCPPSNSKNSLAVCDCVKWGFYN